jgi:hypothetical protein
MLLVSFLTTLEIEHWYNPIDLFAIYGFAQRDAIRIF